MPGLIPEDAGITCDLCGANSFRLLHSWPVENRWNPTSIELSVWKCRHCHLVFLYPVPTADQLHDSGEWWSSRRFSHELGLRRRPWLKGQWEKARYALFRDARTRLVQSTRRLVGSGKLLDVGCGCGELLSVARPFYDCVGIEPSVRAAANCRQKGFSVIENTFEQARIDDGTFDAIIMDSVIEHVQSPATALAKANVLLRRGGVVVLKTPKFGGPSYRLHGTAWNGFRHGYHTFLFDGTTLGKYLEKSGFHVVKYPKRDRMLDDILILWGKKVRDVKPHFSSQHGTLASA